MRGVMISPADEMGSFSEVNVVFMAESESERQKKGTGAFVGKKAGLYGLRRVMHHGALPPLNCFATGSPLYNQMET